MVCEVCKAPVDTACNQKIGGRFIGSYHLERVQAARKKEFDTNLARRLAMRAPKS